MRLRGIENNGKYTPAQTSKSQISGHEHNVMTNAAINIFLPLNSDEVPGKRH
jgi:hypothetical protein